MIAMLVYLTMFSCCYVKLNLQTCVPLTYNIRTHTHDSTHFSTLTEVYHNKNFQIEDIDEGCVAINTEFPEVIFQDQCSVITKKSPKSASTSNFWGLYYDNGHFNPCCSCACRVKIWNKDRLRNWDWKGTPYWIVWSKVHLRYPFCGNMLFSFSQHLYLYTFDSERLYYPKANSSYLSFSLCWNNDILNSC